MMLKNINSYNLIVSLIMTLLFYCVTNKVYNAPFSYGDDHRLLGMLHTDKVSNSYKESLYGITPNLNGCFAIDKQLGRFRPLGWTYNKLLCEVYGDNYVLHRLNNLFVLMLSAFFLLSIFSCFNVDKLSALTVLSVYIFGKNNETWWTLIPPSQNIGELFLLCGIYFWLFYRKTSKTGYFVLPALFFFLSGISKESFIFCIPVLLLTDYFLLNPNKQILAKEYLASAIAFAVPFIFLLVTVISINKIYSYPYQDSIASIFIYNSKQFIYSAVFFLSPLILIFLKRKTLDHTITFKICIVMAIWTITQLILHKGIKLDGQHHYLIPWLIYPLTLTAICLSHIKKYSHKYYKLIFVSYGLVILLFIKNTYINSFSYASSIESYYNMLHAIKKDTSTSHVTYLTNNATIGDWIGGTRVIMDYEDINKELFFCTTEPKIPSWQLNYALNSPQQSFKHISLENAFKPMVIGLY